MGKEKKDKSISDLESRVKTLEDGAVDLRKSIDKVIAQCDEIFKNCKKYIDDANKAQDKKIGDLAKKVSKTK